MSFDFESNLPAVARLIEEFPRDFAEPISKASVRALDRYLGFHRARRMRRKSPDDPVGIYAQRKGSGLAQDKWFPIKKGQGGLGEVKRLADSGAEIRIRSQLISQLEYGATLRGDPWIAVPFSDKQTKGRPRPRTRRLLKQKKLFVVHRGRRRFLAERRGRGRASRLEFHYHLQREIRIKPRLDFQGLFHKDYEDRAVQLVSREISRFTRQWSRQRTPRLRGAR